MTVEERAKALAAKYWGEEDVEGTWLGCLDLARYVEAEILRARKEESDLCQMFFSIDDPSAFLKRRKALEAQLAALEKGSAEGAKAVNEKEMK